MAVGKNTRSGKGGKKGKKKKVVDSFARKEWYDVRVPSVFNVRSVGKTLVTKSHGKRLASDSLKGRVYDCSLADLNNDEDQNFRKMKLQCEDVQGKNCLTNFNGMDITRDRLFCTVRKWQTTIEAQADVRTIDGYSLRIFAIGFTKRRPEQLAKTSYAQTSQQKLIRKKMRAILTEEAGKLTLRELVRRFIPDSIGKHMEKKCSSVFPMQNVYLRKVKILKRPKFDLNRLMTLYEDAGETATPVVPEAPEAANLLAAEIAAAAT